MTPKELEVITQTIETTIKMVVNGKIDAMRKELAEFSQETTHWRETTFADYVKEDIKWKVDAAPVIQAGNSVYAAGKMAVYFFGGLATIAGGLAVVKLAISTLIK